MHNASTCALPFGVPSPGRGARLRHRCPSSVRAELSWEPSRAALESFTEANCHVSSNPYVHRTPATDSRGSADPTSRMGRGKWRIPHVRFVRDVSHENARHFDAKGIQQTDRSSSSRTGTGSNWKLKSYIGGVRVRFVALGPEEQVTSIHASSATGRDRKSGILPMYSICRLRYMRAQTRKRILGQKHCKLLAGRPVFFQSALRADSIFGQVRDTTVQVWTVGKGLGIRSEFSQTCCAANNFRDHEVLLPLV